MSFKRMKPFWIGATVFGVLFAVLLSIRLNPIQSSPSISPLPEFKKSDALLERDVWMNVFQNGRKIGFSHSIMTRISDGYELQETVQLKINTMGMIQELTLNTKGTLLKDLSLSSFEFRMNSGRFQFRASGAVKDRVLSIQTESGGRIQKLDLELENRIYLPAGMVHSLGALNLKPNEVISFTIFDPVSMGQETIDVQMLGKDKIRIMGQVHTAKKVSFTFKGNRQLAWIGEKGEILKESGLLGIEMERTTRAEALYGLPVESSQDLTKVASVESNRVIKDPNRLNRLTVRIEGIDPENFSLDGFRQTFENNILTVIKESLPGPEDFQTTPETVSDEYLSPTPLIQSDHPRIQRLAKRITASAQTPLEKIEQLMDWVYTNIKKRPVLSVPDALSTLENRMGDCNEHSVLLAALARAVGIPAAVEAGLVYLTDRFYYHAWNMVYIGEWISVDALFGQIPADVTHLRFTSTSTHLPMDLIGLIGKVKIHIMEMDG